MSVIRREWTMYGFVFGSARVERMCADEMRGTVTVGVSTPKVKLEVYVTRSGKVRVFSDKGEWKP